MKRLRFLLPVLLLGEALSATEIFLRVRPHVVVAAESEVRLMHLVDAEGLTPALQKKLSGIRVSRAPAPGERQQLSKAIFMRLLKPIVHEERQRGSRIRLLLPNEIVVDTLKRQMMPESVTRELIEAWSPLCSECQLEVDGLSLPKVSQVKDWTLKLKPELPRGSFSVPVTLIREDGASVPAWVSGRLITKRRVPVAKRVLAAQERIQAQDFTWELRDTTLSFDGIPTAEELIGKRVRQGLRADAILWRSLLEKEKAIQRGELVQVKSGDEDWEVSLNVIAQQDAYVGDVVSLRNPKTNSVLMGQVVARGEVELR
ncbi:MAG: flagellar basal body P-ring formation chaperone FlgA [Bdellovibrionales bacterium]